MLASELFMGNTAPPPAELREQSRLYRQAAENETNLYLSRTLASHALALAELAEKIERDEAVREEAAA